MPKQHLTLDNFSGGINSVKDARDLNVNELVDIDKFMVDQQGAIRTAGGLATHTTINNQTAKPSGGYGLAVLESDYETEAITVTGSSNISFLDDYIIFPFTVTQFIAGQQIIISGTSLNNGMFTVRKISGDLLYVAEYDGVITGFATENNTSAVISTHPKNEVLLLSADAVNGKVDTYSKNNDIWTADQITIDSTGGSIPSYAKTIYYTADGAIRASDAELGNASRVRWFGLIKRTDFEGTTAVKRYYDWYEKDNKLSPPTYGIIHSANYPTANLGFNVSLTMGADANSEWEAATYEVAFSFIYDGNQESLLYIPTASNTFPVAAGEKVSAVVRAQTSSTGYNERISGGRIYARISGSDDEWFLLVDIDMRQGARATLDSKYTAWATVSTTTTSTGSVDSLGQNIDTYENLNGYSHDVVSNSMGADGEGYKACVIGNRRAFVANVRRIESNTNELKSFPDRIYYSVANKFDTFPIDYYIDVAIGDSESYTALAIYADRLLAFKENTLYIINISSGSPTDWMKESEHNFMGVLTSAQITKTEMGIAWVNNSGCYFYSGSGNPVNLIGDKIAGLPDKIDGTTWRNFIQTTSMIGYIREKKQLLIMKDYSGTLATSGDCYLFNFPTYSWVKLSDAFTDSKVYTNFIQDWNGDLVVGYFDGTSTIIYYKWNDVAGVMSTQTSGTLTIGKCYETTDYNSGDNFTNVANVIFGTINTTGCKFIATGTTPTTWSNGSELTDITFVKSGMTFTTKDIDFGDLLHIKKVYKIYFTYKSSVAQTNALKYDTNGGTSFSTNVEAKDFSVATGWAIEVFIFSTPIECQSMALKLTCPSSGTFDVNDIVVEFRVLSKRVS